MAQSLFAAFLLKLLQTFLRFGIPLARRSGQQNLCLIAVLGNSFSIPIQLRERNFRVRVPFLHGNPQQPHRVPETGLAILPLQDLPCLQIFLLARFGIRFHQGS
jgi:hypothetical protein